MNTNKHGTVKQEKVSGERITFAEAVSALLAGKCEGFRAGSDHGTIVLSTENDLDGGHGFPVLVFKEAVGDGEPIPAEYVLRECFLVNEKVEMVESPTLMTYVADKAGRIVSGPCDVSDLLIPNLAPGHKYVGIPGSEMRPAAVKKKVKHVIKDVTWHQTKHLEKIDRLGGGYAAPLFPFYPVGPIQGLVAPLVSLFGDKKTTLTIECEE